MKDEPIWLSSKLVRLIHHQQILEHGGLNHNCQLSLLESALNNLPFADGNKRTTYIAMRLFLKLNGYDLQAPPEEKFLYIMAVAQHKITEEELNIWTENNLIKLP